MSWISIKKTIENHLQDNWGTAIQWENRAFAPPSNNTWVRINIQEVGCPRMVLTGNPLTGHRYYGVLQLSVFCPINIGSGLADSYIDSLTTLFREASLVVAGGGYIQFESVDQIIKQVEDSPQRVHIAISIPFEFEK